MVWAGFVEAFLSQYHEPIIPYAAKIAFGVRRTGPARSVSAPNRGPAPKSGNPKSARMKSNSLFIRTPEGIVFSQLLAGPVTRFLAWFIDLLVHQRCDVRPGKSPWSCWN